MRLLVFDNYDSFTYNLVHLAEKILQEKVEVVLNDRMRVEDAALYDKIILSPGPGLPSQAGILLDLIKARAGKIPILGVCLGHQAIAEAFGGRLVNLPRVFHGVATPINILNNQTGIFQGIQSPIEAGRYHSWVVERQSLPKGFEITAVDDDGEIMAMCHQQLKLQSVQFHPESIMTPCGEQLLRNWLMDSMD